MIEFTIPGPPQGKGRPRFTKSGHVYTPEKTVEYEDRVKAEYLRQCASKTLHNKPVHVIIKCFFEIPKSTSKKRRSEILFERPMKKPDADNIAKIIMDALNGIAYQDDKQVASLWVDKCYADIPYVQVYLGEVKNDYL